MKYKPRKGVYEASNVTYNPVTKEAISYGYWTFCKMFNAGHNGSRFIVFNTYPFSTTTRRHQSKVKQLMNELGDVISLEINIGRLNMAYLTFNEVLDYYSTTLEVAIEMLMKNLHKPRIKKATKAKLTKQIEDKRDLLTTLTLLKVTEKEVINA